MLLCPHLPIINLPNHRLCLGSQWHSGTSPPLPSPPLPGQEHFSQNSPLPPPHSSWSRAPTRGLALSLATHLPWPPTLLVPSPRLSWQWDPPPPPQGSRHPSAWPRRAPMSRDGYSCWCHLPPKTHMHGPWVEVWKPCIQGPVPGVCRIEGPPPVVVNKVLLVKAVLFYTPSRAAFTPPQQKH